GQAKDALDVLETAPKPDRGDSEQFGLFCWFKGRAYFHLKDDDPDIKDYKPAIDWLEESVKARPTTWFSWAHLISAHALAGNLKEAEAIVIKEYRPKFEAHWKLEDIKKYYDQPKYDRARRQVQKALVAYFAGLDRAQKEAGFP